MYSYLNKCEKRCLGKAYVHATHRLFFAALWIVQISRIWMYIDKPNFDKLTEREREESYVQSVGIRSDQRFRFAAA